MRVLLVSANREHYPAPVVPLGVLSVAGALRDTHETRVVDLCFEDEPLAMLSNAVASFTPDVIGIGLRNLHDNAYGSSEHLLTYYEEVVGAVKFESRAPIVLGGAAITLQPEKLMERLRPDHAVVGEGEQTFRSIVDTLARSERPERVVRSAVAQRRLVQLDARPGLRLPPIAPSDLDLLPPPARDLVDPRYFEVDGTDGFQTKRGCAFHCTYCDYPDLEGRKIRLRSPERVAEEVAARAQVPGVSHGFFVDSVFNVPRAHALAICEELARRGSPLPWVCYVTPASLDDELVGAMRRAGCIGAEIGTDSGTPRVLRRLKKPFDLDDVRRVRASFVRHEIADTHTFVLGAEGENVEEARATLGFVRELDPDVAVFVVFMEDREEQSPRRAAHHQSLLDLLATEAPKHAGWVVPELGIRFGEKVKRIVTSRKLRGPAWVHLAHARRRPAVSVV
ncbi:MAG TPA: radical SAM protein [Labilithrix sp.]|jgi:hypothetical protein|nr:radical SAM protein [Labilithrix sp.]